MNPFLWLLWALAAIVVLFAAAIVFSVVADKLRERKPCPKCGYRNMYVPDDWTKEGLE